VAAMRSKYGGGDNGVLDDADKMISLAYDVASNSIVVRKRNHFFGVGICVVFSFLSVWSSRF
jgi:hypothetical protein